MRLTGIRSAIVIALLGIAGPALAQQHVEGQTGPGSLYALDLPAAWNGDLVVYAHGILDPVLPVALPAAQDDFTSVRDALHGARVCGRVLELLGERVRAQGRRRSGRTS